MVVQVRGFRTDLKKELRLDVDASVRGKDGAVKPSVRPVGTSTRMRIRVLTPADRFEWIRLRHRLWPHHTLETLTQEADEILSSWKGRGFRRFGRAATVLLAEVGSGRAVGFAEVDLRPFADGCRSSPVGYLEAWYVVPEYRRKSVGRALVRRAEKWARDQGCREMASDTEIDNPASREAHRALGYREANRLVHFRRTLSESPE